MKAAWIFSLFFALVFSNAVDLLFQDIKVMANGKFSTTGQFNYEICEKDQNSFELKSLEIDPNPPQKGQQLKVKVSGVLHEQVSAGTKIYVTVSINGRPFIRKELDLCEELGKVQDAPEHCPLAPGEKNWEYKFDIPDKIPNFLYGVEARIKDQDAHQVFCVKANIKF